MSSLPYRPCVGLMLFNRAGLVFVARRIDMPSEAWQMPQGGIDKGEKPARGRAARAARGDRHRQGGDRRGERKAGGPTICPRELQGVLWEGRFRGQTQKWFLLRFTGKDADIDIATEHPEFLEWKWVELAEVPRLIVPFKRKVYEEVVTEFAPVIERFVEA